MSTSIGFPRIYGFEATPTEREAQLRDYSDAIRDLQGASTSLAKLGNGIALFGDFWMDMQIRLEDLSTRLHLLRGSSAYKCRLRAVISTWNDLTDKFRNYATNVCISLAPVVPISTHPHPSFNDCTTYTIYMTRIQVEDLQLPRPRPFRTRSLVAEVC